MAKSSHIRLLTRILISALVSLLAFLLLRSPAGNWLDSFSYDLFFYLRGPIEAPSDIVVVSVDERSFDEIDFQWPWPRSLHGKLVDALDKAGARVVAFDIFFAEPSKKSEDVKLASSLEKMGSAVLASNIELLEDLHVGFDSGYQLLEPTPILKHMKRPVETGLVSYSLDQDGFLRKTKLVSYDYPSFPLKIAQLASGSNIVGDRSLREVFGINYLGPTRTIQHIPYYQALEPETYLPEGFFENKIVLIGFATVTEVAADEGVPDHFTIPFSRWIGGLMPGVEIHAHVVENIRRGLFIKIKPLEKLVIISCLIAFFFGIVLLSIKPIYGFLLFILLSSTAVGAPYFLFIEDNRFISPVGTFLPLLFVYLVSPFVHYFHARKQRNFIRGAFSTYLAPSVVKELIENPDRLELGGEEREATVLFLDIAGFTAFSEKLQATELIELINRNLGAFAEIILKHNGMIDKYIGDCIMAVWGVPMSDPNHAEHACRAALDMNRELDELVAKEEQRSGVTFSIRIGVNSGRVIAGNVGGGKQFNYTVLGDAVNLAARLESINKHYGTRVILSEHTKMHLDDSFFTREVDTIRVVGQNKPVTIYELCDYRDVADSEEVSFVKDFLFALQAYKTRDWEKALSLFERLNNLHPEDRVTEILIERCRYFLKNPPEADWDGVYQMESK